MSRRSLSRDEGPRVSVSVGEGEDGSKDCLVTWFLGLFNFGIGRRNALKDARRRSLVTNFRHACVLVRLRLQIVRVLRLVTVVPARAIVNAGPSRSVLVLRSISRNVTQRSHIRHSNSRRELPRCIPTPNEDEHRHRRRSNDWSYCSLLRYSYLFS